MHLMNKRLYLLLAGLILQTNLSWTQEVTPTFAFENGLYLSYEEFVRNEPGMSWEDVETSLVTNPRTWITQVEYIRDRESGEAIPMDSLWGLSLDGVPYIRIASDSIDKPLPAFAGLRITGALCYFQYERTESRNIEMAAYNPLTGKPFRRGEVTRDFVELREFVLRWEDGTIGPFSRGQLIQWTTRDQMIQQTLRRLRPDQENLGDQLYNVLLSYNKRHPAFLKDE